MSTLYIVFGPYGSGKTYWSHKLSKQFNAVHLDSDEYYKKTKESRDDGFKAWMLLFQDIYDLSVKGKSVIVDSSHLKKEYRCIYNAWFRKFDKYVLIEIKNTLENCIINNKNRERQIPLYKLVEKYNEIEHIDKSELKYFNELYSINNSVKGATLESLLTDNIQEIK